MECKREINLEKCPCENASCAIQGFCCACLHENLKDKQLPPCLFPESFSLEMDLSFEHFAELVDSKII